MKVLSQDNTWLDTVWIEKTIVMSSKEEEVFERVWSSEKAFWKRFDLSYLAEMKRYGKEEILVVEWVKRQWNERILEEFGKEWVKILGRIKD